VIFMGKRTFAVLASTLQAKGLPGTTQALLAENVSKPDQRLLRSTVAELADYLAETTGSDPALILYGPLVDSGDARS
jgi:uroporphyrin-III C-methyltransferase